MAYIGRGVEWGEFVKQSLTPNSSTTAFEMSHAASANSVIVVHGGVLQEPGVAYSCAGTTITFTSAPITNTPLYLIYLGKELTEIAFTDGEAEAMATSMSIALG